MALPPNNNYLYGNVNLPYENNNQIAFRPNSMKDRQIKQLDVMPDMDQQRYDNLRKEDVEQFNEKGIPLSLPNDRYKGIEGYTANAFGYPQATMTDANSYITRKTPTDTFQSMFQNVDTGRYNTNQNTNFGIGSSRGADQNYTGVTSATQNQTPYNYNEVDKFTNDEQGPIVDQEMQEYFNTLPEEEKEGFGKFLSNAGVNIGNFARDKAMPALKDAAGRTIASQAGSGAGYMLAGPYGALVGGILGAFKGGNIFNAPYRGATRGGGGYTIDQLNKQNARGGYYTDTARSQRRDAASIQNMITRAASGKNYGANRLDRLGKEAGMSKEDISRAITDRKSSAPGHIGNENTTGTGGGKSIVCTAMYQTTGLQDWAKAMKVWYIYQKRHLSDAHQEGYHLLFKPFVKGMHKNKIIRAVGAHVAKHRTQELKHILFNSKSDTLGKIYNKILEPICYIVGKIKFIFKKK